MLKRFAVIDVNTKIVYHILETTAPYDREDLIESESAQVGQHWNGVSFVSPSPSASILKEEYESAVQAHLDSVARSRGYDNIHTACAYAAAPNPYREESAMFVTWRGEVWDYAYNQFNLIHAAEREIPSIPEIIAELPTFA